MGKGKGEGDFPSSEVKMLSTKDFEVSGGFVNLWVKREHAFSDDVKIQNLGPVLIKWQSNDNQMTMWIYNECHRTMVTDVDEKWNENQAENDDADKNVQIQQPSQQPKKK